MNRIILLLIIIILTISLIVVFANTKDVGKSDVVVNKETALKIGRALLEERFPDVFSNEEITIDGEENDGIWRVHNVLQRQCDTEDGDMWILVGGEVYVEFRKSNGEVLNIGVSD